MNLEFAEHVNNKLSTNNYLEMSATEKSFAETFVSKNKGLWKCDHTFINEHAGNYTIINNCKNVIFYSLYDLLLESAVKRYGKVKISSPSKGYSKEVYVIEISDVSYYARITFKNKDEVISVYNVLRDEGVPVEEIFDYWTDDKSKATIIIKKTLSGCPIGKISNANKRQSLLKKMGKILRSIHDIELSKFIYSHSVSWVQYLEQWYSAKSEHELVKVLHSTEIVDVKNLFIEIEYLVSACVIKPLHGDFHCDHVYVNSNSIEAIIDFDKFKYGDRFWDIAITCYEMNDKDFEMFLKGYGLEINERLINIYLVLIALDKLKWALISKDVCHVQHLAKYYKYLEKLKKCY